MLGDFKLHLSYQQSHINGVETITQLSVSGKKRDEQKQATLAKQRETYQKKKACETEAQKPSKRAKERENYQKRKASETGEQRQARHAEKK